MQINAGEAIEDAVIKNMLQAHSNMAKYPSPSGQDIKEFVRLSRVLFKIAQKNRNKVINIITEDDGDRGEYPPENLE